MYLYMKVTKDKYEFPVAIADSAAELARMVGVKTQTVQSCICRTKPGENCGYFKVKVEDEDE